jgi:hypothetical protein
MFARRCRPALDTLILFFSIGRGRDIASHRNASHRVQRTFPPDAGDGAFVGGWIFSVRAIDDDDEETELPIHIATLQQQQQQQQPIARLYIETYHY